MEWHRIAYFVPMVPLRTYSHTPKLSQSDLSLSIGDSVLKPSTVDGSL